MVLVRAERRRQCVGYTATRARGAPEGETWWATLYLKVTKQLGDLEVLDDRGGAVELGALRGRLLVLLRVCLRLRSSGLRRAALISWRALLLTHLRLSACACYDLGEALPEGVHVPLEKLADLRRR